MTANAAYHQGPKKKYKILSIKNNEMLVRHDYTIMAVLFTVLSYDFGLG